jgi:hypothetical protein
MNQQKCLPVFFSDLSHNKVNSDAQGIISTSSLKCSQYLKKNLRPEGHSLHI